MKITRAMTADKLAAYLRHQMSLSELVIWAEEAIQEGVFEETDLDAIRDVVARLGLADVRAFGLTWEDCEGLLKRLGYQAQVHVVAA
jgi:hypothetical protein